MARCYAPLVPKYWIRIKESTFLANSSTGIGPGVALLISTRMLKRAKITERFTSPWLPKQMSPISEALSLAPGKVTSHVSHDYVYQALVSFDHRVAFKDCCDQPLGAAFARGTH